MADSQVSLGASLIYAWDLWRSHWRAIWGSLALISLTATVQLAGAYSNRIELMAAGALALVLIEPVLYGAIFRLAFADRHPGDPAFAPGHAGLQWRAMEWRVLGASALLLVFFAIIFMLALVLVGGLAVGILMSQGMTTAPATPEAFTKALGDTGQTAVLALMLVCAIILLFFYLRLSLAFPATADTGRLTVLKSWPLTRGQVLRILAAIFLIRLPLTLAQTFVAGLADSDRLGLSSSAQMAPGAALAAAVAIGVVYGGLVAPLNAGVLAYYYRNLSGAVTGAKS